VLAIGTGEPLLAAGESLLRNGLAGLTLAPDAAGYADDLRAAALELRFADDDVTTASDGVAVLEPGGSAADSIVAGRFDAVLHCTDGPASAELLAVNARCLAAGVLLLPMTLLGTRAVIGPLVAAPDGPCWLCAQLRLTGNADPALAAEAWREVALGPLGGASGQPLALTETVARMLGNTVAFELFRALADLPDDVTGSVVILDTTTLVAEREQLLRHPGCPSCPAAAGTPTPIPAELPERLERLVGRHTGLISGYSDDALHQVPVKTGALRTGRRELVAFDVDSVLAARLAAGLAVARDHASGMVDRHRLVHEPAIADRQVSAARLVTWTGVPVAEPADDRPWLPAISLGDQRARLVPAAAVHPDSALNRHGAFERTPAGSAVGGSLAEVTDAGLDSLLAYLRLRDLVRGSAAVVPLPRAEAAGTDPRLAFLLDSADQLAPGLVLLETVGPGPLHLHLARTEAVWAVGVGRSGPLAAIAAVRDVVGQLQLLHFEGRRGDLGPPLLPGFDPRADLAVATAERSRFDAGPTDTERLLAGLADAGLDALLVETTTTDLRAAGLVAGRVLGRHA
jgi:bacteriocin biosynthesis cyclodehydratase domain-containing protein